MDQPASRHTCPPLHCDAVDATVKRFYDEQSEWGGIFRMTPIKANQVSDVECDVLYTYVPVLGLTRTDGLYQDSGRDKRRFRFSQNDACRWTVESMDGYHSGASLLDMACLHLNCDDLGYQMKQAFVETGGFGPQQAERDTIRIQQATKLNDTECEVVFGFDSASDVRDVYVERYTLTPDGECDWTVSVSTNRPSPSRRPSLGNNLSAKTGRFKYG